jgi:peptidoglycan DL-endopeptidase CwlO
MARRSFVGGGSVPLGPLFEDSDNLNDAVKRDQLARVALSAGDITTDEFEALVAEINDDKDALASKRDQADQLADSLTDAQSETERLTSEYTQARADAEAKLGELIAQEEQRRAEESARRLREQAAATAAAPARTSTSGNGGTSTSGGSSTSGESSTSGGSSTPSGAGSGGSSSGSGGGTAAPAPAVSSRAGIAVQAALAQRGVPYRYATSIPGEGFDCSGLTGYAWAQAGVGLPHQSRLQYAATPRVPISEAQAGDLLFFYSPISHVSIYLGNGTHVHAPNTGTVVNVSSVNWGKVVGVGRPG